MDSTHKIIHMDQFYTLLVQKFSSTWATGSHFGFMLIMQIAQGCIFGNQAKIIVETYKITNQQKNFIGKNFARFIKIQTD